MAAGLDDVEGFNYLARHAIEWTAAALTPDNRAWLAALPKGPVIVEPFVEICHGAPFDEDCYIFDDLDATRALRAARAPLCLYGHTHVPAVFRLSLKGRNGDLQTMAPPRGPRFKVSVDHEARYLVNCGAVGQPRDGDPQAAFGMLDTDARTAHDHAGALRRRHRAGQDHRGRVCPKFSPSDSPLGGDSQLRIDRLCVTSRSGRGDARGLAAETAGCDLSLAQPFCGTVSCGFRAWQV